MDECKGCGVKLLVFVVRWLNYEFFVNDIKCEGVLFFLFLLVNEYWCVFKVLGVF